MSGEGVFPREADLTVNKYMSIKEQAIDLVKRSSDPDAIPWEYKNPMKKIMDDEKITLRHYGHGEDNVDNLIISGIDNKNITSTGWISLSSTLRTTYTYNPVNYNNTIISVINEITDNYASSTMNKLTISSGNESEKRESPTFMRRGKISDFTDELYLYPKEIDDHHLYDNDLNPDLDFDTITYQYQTKQFAEVSMNDLLDISLEEMDKNAMELICGDTGPMSLSPFLKRTNKEFGEREMIDNDALENDFDHFMQQIWTQTVITLSSNIGTGTVRYDTFNFINNNIVAF